MGILGAIGQRKIEQSLIHPCHHAVEQPCQRACLGLRESQPHLQRAVLRHPDHTARDQQRAERRGEQRADQGTGVAIAKPAQHDPRSTRHSSEGFLFRECQRAGNFWLVRRFLFMSSPEPFPFPSKSPPETPPPSGPAEAPPAPDREPSPIPPPMQDPDIEPTPVELPPMPGDTGLPGPTPMEV